MFEEFKKQQRGGFSPRTRPGGLFSLTQVNDPKARIIVLVVLLLVMVGLVLLLRSYSVTPQSQPGATEVPAPAVGVSHERLDFATIPTFDPEIANRITDQGPDARRRWEDEAIPYLLQQTHIPAVYAYNAMLLPLVAGSVGQIAENSRPWRFKFVRFRGELEYMVERDYDQVHGGNQDIGEVRRGRTVLMDDGKPVRVTFVTAAIPMWTDPDDITAESVLIEDGWVRGRGILVKNYLDDFTGDEVPSVLVVATDIQRDYEVKPVESLADVPFQIIQDDPSFVGEPGYRNILARLFPKPLFRLVKWASQFAGTEHADARKKEGLQPRTFDDPSVYEEMLGAPAAFRAEYFGGLGVLALTPQVSGPENTPPNDAGVQEYMHGWIMTDRQRLVWFAAPAELAYREWAPRDRILWEGYFYKWRAYPARDGQDRLAPMFVLTRLEIVPPPERDLAFQLYLAGGFILGIALLIFIIVREDRVKQEYRRRHGRAPVGSGAARGTRDDDADALRPDPS